MDLKRVQHAAPLDADTNTAGGLQGETERTDARDSAADRALAAGGYGPDSAGRADAMD